VSLGGARPKLASGGTSNLSAYDLYLKGRYLWNHRTASALDQAARVFNEAIKLDPQYALAYAGLADVYAVSPQYALTPSEESLDRARTAAVHALALDSTLSEAHATLGMISHRLYDRAEGHRELRLAIAMNPSYATAHHWYALVLENEGHLDEAFAEIERARALDPVSPIFGTVKGTLFYYKRDYPRAIRQFQQVLAADPGFGIGNRFLARSYAVTGDYLGALSAMKATAAVSGVDEAADFGWIFGRMGRRGEADSVLASARERATHGHVLSSTFALIHLGLGNRDSALAWTRRAVDEHDADMMGLKLDPRFDPLRSDPRFQQILARMKFEAGSTGSSVP
jgi:tetratricopeptide (TPR) repeat protein